MLVLASKFSGSDFLNEAFKTSGKCLELLPPGLDLEVGSHKSCLLRWHHGGYRLWAFMSPLIQKLLRRPKFQSTLRGFPELEGAYLCISIADLESHLLEKQTKTENPGVQ